MTKFFFNPKTDSSYLVELNFFQDIPIRITVRMIKNEHIRYVKKHHSKENFQKLKSDQSLIMSQTNNLNPNLKMILVLKFDDIKNDIETQ